MNATAVRKEPPDRAARGRIALRVQRLRALLDAIEGDPWGEDAIRRLGLPAALEMLQRELARLRTEIPEPGHDGRAPEFHEAVGRTAGESKAGNYERTNIHVDRLEEIAHTDDEGTTIHRLASRKDAQNQPLINELQLRAGRRLQEDFRVMDLSSGGASMEIRVSGGQGSYRLPDARLDAQDRYRKAMRAVGETSEKVLEAIVIDDLTLEEAAAARRWNKKGMAVLLRAALDALIQHYKRVDERRDQMEDF